MANQPPLPPSAPDDGDDPFCLDFTKISAKPKPIAAAAVQAPIPPTPPKASPAPKAPVPLAPVASVKPAAPAKAPERAAPPAPPPVPTAPAPSPAVDAPKVPLGKLRQKLAARQAAQENSAPAAATPPAPTPVAEPAPAQKPAAATLALMPLEAAPLDGSLLDFIAPDPTPVPAMPPPSSFEVAKPAFFLGESEPFFLDEATGQAKPIAEKSAGEQLLDEVALLHAADSSPDALSKLETALRAGTLGDATEQGWGVLFDLLQTLNRRPAFETLADAYAKRFEKSAPAWLDADDAVDASAETGGAAQVALSGTLSAASESALKKLIEISQKNPIVHLNLVKATDADNDGCRLLLDTLRAFKKNKRECLIVGAEEFVAMLASKIEMMQREREETWLLLLELSQQTGKQEFFEDIAVGYAVTFEVSPPSWETVATSKKSTAGAHAKVVKDPMVLEGELLIGMGAIAALASAAKGKDAITIEIDRLQRIDAASAHALLSELTPLAAHGMHIRIRGVSMLIATLFHIVGIDQIASIEIRRR